MSFIKSFFTSIIIAILLAGIVAGLFGSAVYSKVEGTSVDLSKLEIEPKPTYIYDKNGNEIARFRQERKDVTKFEEIPETIIQAVIATEDAEFFDHVGINVKAIVRAAYANFQANGKSQGGSTITQQLVKNMYLTNEKSYERKIKEAMISTTLESMVEKEEILTNYLNHIDFGYRALGVRNAVETYFGQSLEEFKNSDKIDQIAKAALLGGLPQQPYGYNPYKNPESALQRRNTVLANMLKEGYITRDEFEQAYKKSFLILDKPNEISEIEELKYEEVVHYILAEAAINLGYSTGPISEVKEAELKQAMYGGHKIYTSFDPEVYKILRKHFENDDLFPRDAKDGVRVEGSVSFVNPNNGEIIAFTGGRDEPKFLKLNRAFLTHRQPGSSFKPIISYGPAIESGKFHPWSVLLDEQDYEFPGGYKVKNYNGRDRGKMTLIDAITVSENVPAVYLLNETGLDYAKNYAKNLGIDLSKEPAGLALALGGLNKGVSTLQMADAYQAYANGGYRVPAHIIKRMVSPDNEVVFEVDTELNEEKRVIKSQTATYMRYLLRNVVERGTGTRARVSGEIVAGKTGTTEYPKMPGHNKDIWFTGFTTEFVGSVWMGFDNSDKEHNLTDTSWVNARMFGAIAKDLKELKPDGDGNFIKPTVIKPDIEEFGIEGYYDKEKEIIYISWKEEEDTSFKVIRNGEDIVEELNQSNYTDKKFEKGETYTYQIVGFNKYSNFETYRSNTVKVEVPKPIPPNPSTFVSKNVQETSVTLIWQEVVDAKGYILKRDGQTVYTGTELTFIDSGLNPNTEYTYQLIVQGEEVNSEPTNASITTNSQEPIDDGQNDEEEEQQNDNGGNTDDENTEDEATEEEGNTDEDIYGNDELYGN